MARAHEGALVTKLTGAITKVEVNPNIAPHSLFFSPIIQEMDAWHQADNLPDLHNYLKKLDTYTLKFYQRTQDSNYKIEHPSDVLHLHQMPRPS